MLDIQTLTKLALPTVSKRDLEGLSKLCVRLLDGVALDKNQQISPWHLRPLTEEQLVYAGLDAWALVQLFDAVICLLKDGYEGNTSVNDRLNADGATADGSVTARISTSTSPTTATTVVTSSKKKRCKSSGVTVEDSLRKVAKQYHLALPVPYQDFMVLPESDVEIGVDEKLGLSEVDEKVGVSGVGTTVGVSTKPFLPLKAIRMEEKNMAKDWTYRYNPSTRP